MSSRPSAKVLSESPRSSPPPIGASTDANGTSSAAPSTRKTVTRQRSSSSQKGAAVLRALSRAESDFDREQLEKSSDADTRRDPVAAPPMAEASGTNLNGSVVGDTAVRRRPQAAATKKTSSTLSAPKSSRSNGHVAPASSKSWEIPRKIFHSSMGLLVLQLYLSDVEYTTVVRRLSIFLGIVVTADVIRLNNHDFEQIYERVLGFLMRESEKDKVNGVVWYLIGVITSLHFFPEDIACVSVMILSWCDTAASTFGRLFGRYTPALPSPPFARRKSTAGFIAAIVSGALTTYLFWCTSIASRGVRANGISWSGSGYAHPAIFGTDRAAGATGTGWQGVSAGFRGQSGAGLLPAASGVAAQYLGADSVAKGKLGTDALPVYNDVPGMPVWLLTLGSGLVAAVAEGLELGGVDDNLSLPILSATGIWTLFYSWGRLAGAWQKWFS
ncbi:diacylglycerol kinase [Mycosarcoma maydis]|uniref:Uncharacterized protein n=1 Tax=Mycosarcoma maydis TaxID=5270 RepID=A0A0D1DWY1_MYCMD|nr:diacylglycerol kinase [Ustilago maydis 521]KIS67025.1 hypothetical protein UMAG_04898 [Ustilago maydis 521]|eukprot:XP_011391223.1 hypothetical protein UMAG_04898 [Ustilago maydis 521]